MSIVSEVYRKTRKRPDLFWNTYVCRPPAAVVVAALRNTPVTPNQITFAAFFLALAACGILLVVPGHAGLLVGVVVFQLSYVLDCADGMLARWRNIQSTQGHLLDFLMDEIKAFIVFGSVAVRMWRETGDERWLLVGIGGLAALASGIAITSFMRRPEYGAKPPTAEGQPAEIQRRSGALGWGLTLFEHAARSVVHYPQYIWLCAAVNRMDIYVLAYAGVNVLYLGYTSLALLVRLGRFR